MIHEYELIQHLRQTGSDFVRATVPGPLAVLDLGQHVVVIERHLTGRAMDGLMAINGPSRLDLIRTNIDLAIRWLLRCQQETPLQRSRLTDAQLNFHFLQPIERMRSMSDLTAQEESFLIQLMARILTLSRLPLPLVISHGDFQPGNLMMQTNGIQVIDWEFGYQSSLPLLDVFGFLLRVCHRDHGLEEMNGDLEDYLTDFEAVFFGNGPLAQLAAGYVDLACRSLHIDRAWVSVLFGMFLVTEANKYARLLRHRAEKSYLYLMRSREGLMADSYTTQLRRQKNVWLLGYLARNESRLIFNRLSGTATQTIDEKYSAQAHRR